MARVSLWQILRIRLALGSPIGANDVTLRVDPPGCRKGRTWKINGSERASGKNIAVLAVAVARAAGHSVISDYNPIDVDRECLAKQGPREINRREGVVAEGITMLGAAIGIIADDQQRTGWSYPVHLGRHRIRKIE